MDWHIIWVIVIVLVAVIFLCALWLAPWWRPRPGDDTQAQELLKRFSVIGNEHVRARLSAEVTRRQRWGAYGGATGATSALLLEVLANLLGSDAVGQVVAVEIGAAGVYGMFTGQALSALFPWRRRPARVRVTARQPHPMSDYLHSAQIAILVLLALLGWTTVIVAGSALMGWTSLSQPRPTTIGVAWVGALLALPPTAVLLLQRSLLSRPRSATDRDELIIADVVLTVGLCDLYVTGVAASGLATVALAFTPGRPWWLFWVYAAAGGLTILVRWSIHGRQNLAPVAQRLSAEQVAT